jgi:hypothetical protein
VRASEPRIVYRPDATPTAAARLAALRYAIENHERKEATRPGGPDDVRKDQDAHTATEKYTS